ncbi:MAG: MbnP family protein [Bacteroidota bacterium]
MKILLKICSFCLMLGFLSCKKDDTSPQPEPEPVKTAGKLKIEFNNMVGDSALVFNKKYINPRGDTFTVTKFNYYISNISVTMEDNSVFNEPESFHVIKHTSVAPSLLLQNVPAGAYKSIKFTIGVDSARNCSGAQTGGLDPAGAASDMYWSWNTGYIFLKLEGTSPRSTSGEFAYHIGGYGGANKTQRNFNISFGAGRMNVSTSATPRLVLKTDINEILGSPAMIDFATLPAVMNAGPDAKMMADNYSDMITIKSIASQ